VYFQKYPEEGGAYTTCSVGRSFNPTVHPVPAPPRIRTRALSCCTRLEQDFIFIIEPEGVNFLGNFCIADISLTISTMQLVGKEEGAYNYMHAGCGDW
jgi:hypothetical protein